MAPIEHSPRSTPADLDQHDGADERDQLDDGSDDDLDEDERAALHAALDAGLADVRAGRTIPAAVLLARLDAQK